MITISNIRWKYIGGKLDKQIDQEQLASEIEYFLNNHRFKGWNNGLCAVVKVK